MHNNKLQLRGEYINLSKENKNYGHNKKKSIERQGFKITQFLRKAFHKEGFT